MYAAWQGLRKTLHGRKCRVCRPGSECRVRSQHRSPPSAAGTNLYDPNRRILTHTNNALCAHNAGGWVHGAVYHIYGGHMCAVRVGVLIPDPLCYVLPGMAKILSISDIATGGKQTHLNWKCWSKKCIVGDFVRGRKRRKNHVTATSRVQNGHNKPFMLASSTLLSTTSSTLGHCILP